MLGHQPTHVVAINKLCRRDQFVVFCFVGFFFHFAFLLINNRLICEEWFILPSGV